MANPGTEAFGANLSCCYYSGGESAVQRTLLFWQVGLNNNELQLELGGKLQRLPATVAQSGFGRLVSAITSSLAWGHPGSNSGAQPSYSSDTNSRIPARKI